MSQQKEVAYFSCVASATHFFILGGIFLRCKNSFCIYWKDKNCILDEISLDIQGQCEDCIYIDLDEKILEEKRNEKLKQQ